MAPLVAVAPLVSLATGSYRMPQGAWGLRFVGLHMGGREMAAADATTGATAGGVAGSVVPPAFDLDALPIARPLKWYALVHDSRVGYRTLPLGRCDNLRQFCQYLNHVPAPGSVFDGRHGWKIGGRHWGYGMCVFQADILPEWEHLGNRNGADLVCRGCFEPAALTEAWRSLLLLLVDGRLEWATGIRLAMKTDRRGSLLHKLEVWTRSTSGCNEAVVVLHAELGLEFVVVPRRLGKK